MFSNKVIITILAAMSLVACSPEKKIVYVDKDTGKELPADQAPIAKKVDVYLNLPVKNTDTWSGDSYHLHRRCIDGYQYYFEYTGHGGVAFPVLYDAKNGSHIRTCDPKNFKVKKGK
ncbi:hypothetical protein VspSw1_91 [Vibrio phage VspSw_1]|uniref:Lipoprotein n=1 Tax=Vibrio phage VspSw_1 TaxID=2484249 RepID=A0A411BKK3_9CAUD|nr:hypothetical protein HOV08_gp091 [Vibrio phage VspSw_1]QAY02161.1 hypothetical protein VspSw1_91 [Vibrio phage VspSw_1]